jgi:hypothetical protein
MQQLVPSLRRLTIGSTARTSPIERLSALLSAVAVMGAIAAAILTQPPDAPGARVPIEVLRTRPVPLGTPPSTQADPKATQ